LLVSPIYLIKYSLGEHKRLVSKTFKKSYPPQNIETELLSILFLQAWRVICFVNLGR